MKTSIAKFKQPAILGFMVVLPFIALQLINEREYTESFPFPLFGILWLISTGFFLLFPSLRHFPDIKINGTIVTFFGRIAGLIILGFMWVSIVVDQMPCFLGIPNCD